MYLGAFFQKQRLISAFNLTKAAWPDWIRIYFISFLLFLVITGLFLNARQFHNFYRMSTYEEYLRGRYPKLSIEEADALLSKYHEVSDRSSKKAQDLFEKALQYEKEKNYVLALRYFNLSIDQDPLNPEVYFQRGRMKINRLELNKDLAYSSIIDFTESIRFRPDHGASYFNRGIIFSYLDKKEPACADMTEAFRINPKFDVMPFVKKCCPKDSASFVPLHP